MGISFEYEPEGYDINGRWYLPDFRIHYGPGYYVEIKPVNQSEVELYCEFSRLVAPVILICGHPVSGRYECFRFESDVLIHRGHFIVSGILEKGESGKTIIRKELSIIEVNDKRCLAEVGPLGKSHYWSAATLRPDPESEDYAEIDYAMSEAMNERFGR